MTTLGHLPHLPSRREETSAQNRMAASNMTFPARQLAQRLLVIGAVAFAGCASSDDPEVEAYAKLEGVYELESIERFVGACDDAGTANSLAAIPKLWVAYVVEHGVPDTQLHAHGCSSVEQCRTQAEDSQADGVANYATDFTRYVYSRVAGSGAIDGVGVNLVGVVDDKCRLDLEETFVERHGDETLYSHAPRLPGKQKGQRPDASDDSTCVDGLAHAG